jgi:hypothetical protein
MKFLVIAVVAASVLMLSACASTDAPRSEVAKDESCRVTGSNLPKRECRGDVTVLPPSALEKVGASPAGSKNN